MQEIRMKRSKTYTAQCNVRVEPELKADLIYLDDAGVDVADNLRPVIREAVAKMKKGLADKTG